MKIPRPINRLIENFSQLPSIGPKTAQRLTLYLLRFPQEEIEKFADALLKLKVEIQTCSVCKNVGETNPCEICADTMRNQNIIAVVSSPMDVFSFEKTGFKGVYHVLHGLIDPLNNVGPDELYINDLLKRLQVLQGEYQDQPLSDQPLQHTDVEVILATNTSMEGESTAMYIAKLIKNHGFYAQNNLKITRIARGLPVGGDIEYADETTLMRALDGRGIF